MSDAEEDRISVDETIEGTEENEGVRVHESPFPGSRLMIKEMVLENFKSYAGVKRIGPFHKCFSSIVGPNGSGKSNVIDAMLFVFGKRAKKLRLNKVSELIHNSTAFPNCEFAKVTVHFQNIIDREDNGEKDDEGFDVVPGSEIEVCRVAYQSNKSEYFVEGKKKTFSEVANLLMTRGIDLHNNRFLILQGEVEQISLMKPKAQTEHEDGLLEYLEDIIGSNRHVDQIEAESKRVEELSELRNEKLNRVKVVEKEKDSLEDTKKEADDFLLSDRQLTEKRSWLVQLNNRKANQDLKEMEEKRNELAAEVAEKQQIIDKHSTVRKALEKELSVASDAHEEIQKSLKKKKQEFGDCDKKDFKLRQDMKDAQSAVKTLTATIEKQEKVQKTSAAKLETVRKETIPALEEEAVDIKAKQTIAEKELEDLYESLQGKTAELRAELESKQGGLADLSQQVSIAKSKLDMVQTKIELQEETSNAGKKQLKAAEEKLEQIEILLASRPKELEAGKRDLEKAELDLERVKADLAQAQEKEKELEVTLRVSRTKTESAKAQLASSSSKGALQQALAQAKATKGNPINESGLFGRLGDLGTIEKQYDVAVSTACAGLDYLVTETTKGAETCVKYLRDNNLGRATFAILDKLQHLASKMDRPIQTPEGVPRLFDLITVKDSRFRVAFYHTLRDTLVAQDLDQAVRIAYEGGKCVWRVVTLSGQVIDTSGTMSGGGNRVKKGGMKIKEAAASTSRHGAVAMDVEEVEIEVLSEKQVLDLEKSTAIIAEELGQLRNKRHSLSKEKIRLENLISDLSLVVPKMELELKELEKQRKQITENMKSIQPACDISDEDTEKLRALYRERDECAKSYNEVNATLGAMERETSELHKKISHVGGPKAKALKDSISSFESALEKNRQALSSATSELKKASANVAKATKLQAEAQVELEEARTRIDLVTKEFSSLEEQGLSIAHELEALQESEEENKATVEDLVRQLKEQKSNTNSTEKALVELKNKLSEYDEHDIPRKRTVVSNLSEQLKKLKQHFCDLLKMRQDAYGNEDREEDGDEDHEADGEKEESKKVDKISGSWSMNSFELDDEQLDKLEVRELGLEIELLDQEVTKLKKSVNLGAIKEFLQREKEYSDRVSDLNQATEMRDAAREACEALRKKRLNDFMAGFSQITIKLKEMYQMITLGGDAELELVDSCDPFSEGIVFSVRPPKKSWKNISNLSGGEKTLSSLALVFALHHYKPSPLFVMDEIDAALDFKNVSIIASYIKERTKNAQFIIISLRNNMFELADRLVGIYKTHDATKTITINPAKVVKASLERMKTNQVPNENLNSSNRSQRSPLQPLNM